MHTYAPCMHSRGSISVVFVRSISKQLPISLSLRINMICHHYLHHFLTASTRQHYTPPCFEGVAPLYEDVVPQAWRRGHHLQFPLQRHCTRSNTGMGPYQQEQALYTACTVASLEDLEGSEPL